ncbi:hypothetical protein [Amycolatopsis mediterranei]|uniref:Uncharacterized protein n=1 Tax=Amycolatopsis mediterranei (strain S699) TaxID=713604 RepID=A0A9R0UD30_AMYMS|nr:hypothetical protein [Amycolatopsis mediterranei]AEK46496.1 hypothetical protein RAM_40145 [Amycolatopsis mediterranei S699]UZF74533.1 hypothetical protein ISP_008057 [Amycolatopsis mediterranei]
MPTLTAVADWTITARFTHASSSGYWAPRVWSSRGLAIAEADVAPFDKALGERC